MCIRDRVFIIGIVQIDVHRVDVVRGSRGNINDLPLGTELLYLSLIHI